MTQPSSISGTILESARADKALAGASGLSRARIQALIAQGHVTLDGDLLASASAKIAAGAGFAIALPAPTEPAAQPQDIALDIAYEDEHLVIVNKPAGMVVHPAAGNADGTLVNALLHHCKGALSGIGGVARPGIVHRIDKDTSGLLAVAKTDAAHEGLAKQFSAHSIHRRYIALCSGHPRPASGTIEARLGRSDRDRKKMAVLDKNSSRGKNAVTHYTTQMHFAHSAMIACTLETGRTHQVRVHCASIGHALLGDPVYGRAPKALRSILDKLQFKRQALHASELGFIHPATGKTVHFEADLPPDMRELIDELARFDR